MSLVLITTSGTGSRLGDITAYTNKSLVPLGNKYALAHIIDSYPESTEFIITIGYKGELVQEFCSLAYPTRAITFVKVDKYEGLGSSLLYSMLQAKNFLQRPFIFHCCDTILIETIPTFTENTALVVKGQDANSYASICGSNGRISSFYEKGFVDNDFCYIGITYYHDYLRFWQCAEDLYESQQENMSLSDIHVIQTMMLKGVAFHYHNVHEFFDTGNLTSYAKAQSHFHHDYDILTKNNESLCFLPTSVIKFQADKSINEKRYERGRLLQPYTPKLLGKTNHFLQMEFVEGTLLAESLDYGDIAHLLSWGQENLWSHTSSSSDFQIDCFDFYITKTQKRLSQLKYISKEASIINGIEVGSIDSLFQAIDPTFLQTDTFTKFHGDFILDNIIKKSDQSFVLLDWRHEFGRQIAWGDCYYDLAKLQHNIIFNHKNIKNNLFSVSQMENEVNIDIKCNYILMHQRRDFDSFLQKYNYNKKKVDMLTAIVWLNMAPLYEGDLQRFLFYFGKLHLYFALSDVRP